MDKVYDVEGHAVAVRDALNSENMAKGEARRWRVAVAPGGAPKVGPWVVVRSALGYSTVVSAGEVECHAASAVARNDLSASGGASSPRAKSDARILAYWQACGIARKVNGTTWEVLDVVNGGTTWLRFAAQGEENRADRAVFSHVRSVANVGAACGCGLLPENGDANESRGQRNMIVENLPQIARDVLNGWPDYWFANYARKASKARCLPF